MPIVDLPVLMDMISGAIIDNIYTTALGFTHTATHGIYSNFIELYFSDATCRDDE